GAQLSGPLGLGHQSEDAARASVASGLHARRARRAHAGQEPQRRHRRQQRCAPDDQRRQVQALSAAAGGSSTMSNEMCAVAGDTKVETPEGPLAIRTLVTTPTAVLTRTDAGVVRFAMMRGVQKADGMRSVVRVTLDNGLSFRVAPSQILLKRGMVEVAA